MSTDELFSRLAHELAAAGRWHELFEARLVEARSRLGLSLTDSPSLDDLPEPARTTLENDYTAACREVGGLLLDAGRLREAWRYLRPAGEKRMMRAALARSVPTTENIEPLIELALYEGVDVERGYGWMLGHLGTCNAITTLEGLAHQLSHEDLAACATVLVRHVDRELRENLRNHIGRQEPTKPAARATVTELMEGRDWLFEVQASHVDASHLAATVRFARVLTVPPLVELALGLAEYGARLDTTLQYAGEAPFEDLYESHRHFFLATLGREVPAALDYFRARADESDLASDGTAPLETLLVLLERTGHAQEAMEIFAREIPADAQLSPFAPRLLDLAAKSGDWERYETILTDRDDPVGLAIGVVHRQQLGAAERH
ncbi:hypothetical protein [Aeoliella sp. SH292]|uniref:hypothetical protein n=1 Tax=Aeoliella sp. SH292 TaxID=3454464 RepID=UPI003F972393